MNELAERGFIHHKRIFPGSIPDLEKAITALFEMQADKIKDYRGLKGLEAICAAMEENDKKAIYEVQKFVASSPKVVAFFQQPWMNNCADLLGVKPERMLLEGPALFVNRPNSQRLLYKWHSEEHFYPKRRRFLNLWFPLFGAKTKDNGCMSIMPGSHKKQWPSADYRGYNKDTEKAAHHFVQKEVPEYFLSEYQEHWCESEPGDLIVFHRNLVHRSNPNTTNEYSFAMVARVWTPEDDLTLCGSMLVPDGYDHGRADLVVRP